MHLAWARLSRASCSVAAAAAAVAAAPPTPNFQLRRSPNTYTYPMVPLAHSLAPEMFTGSTLLDDDPWSRFKPSFVLRCCCLRRPPNFQLRLPPSPTHSTYLLIPRCRSLPKRSRFLLYLVDFISRRGRRGLPEAGSDCRVVGGGSGSGGRSGSPRRGSVRRRRQGWGGGRVETRGW